MTETGRLIRMQRIFNRDTGKAIIVPMDHGIGMGPIDGLVNMRDAVGKVAIGGANAVILHKGIVAEGLRAQGPDVGLIIHLSASTSLSMDSNAKTLVCTVEEAIKLGADAVSIQVNIGNEYEKEMLRDFGEVSRKAKEWGIPLLAMIYPRGKKVKNEYDVEVIKLAARVGAEMGADIIKVSYTGDEKSFRDVIAGCCKPVLIAGGAKMDSDEEILEMVKGAMDAGAAGTSIGRNIFQHSDPGKMVEAIAMIVHGGKGVEEALRVLSHKNG